MSGTRRDLTEDWRKGAGHSFCQGHDYAGSHRSLLSTRRQPSVETDCIPNAVYRPIPSIWGHLAGIGMHQEDNDFIDAAIQECLAS